MLPVLRRLYENPSPDGVHPPLPEIALRRLYQLAPEEGRRLILEEIRSLQPRAGIKSLTMLPEKELPELDDVLANNLENSTEYETLTLHAQLVQRYASKAAMARIEAATRDKMDAMACLPKYALLSYFLRAG